jgi:hypothetical protein
LKVIKFASTAVISILQTIKRRKVNWIARILRRNCLIKQVISGEIEGRIKVTGRRGSRSKQLLDSLKETKEYWKLKRGSARSQYVENWLCKRLRTCCKTGKRKNEANKQTNKEGKKGRRT